MFFIARGRNSKYVKTLTHRDLKLFKQLGRTGLSNIDQAKENCKLSKERITKLENSGLIKTKSVVSRGKQNTIIQLEKKGKKYLTQNHNFKSFPVSQTNHATHDMKLAEIYYKLPDQVQDTWRHESQVREDIYEKNNGVLELKTCIDATVIINGNLTGIEAVGDSYSEETIETKENFGYQFAQVKEMILI